MRSRRRIAQARLTRVALPVSAAWTMRFGSQLERTILHLAADDGTHGHAELAGDTVSFVQAQELAAALTGADAMAPRVASRLLRRETAAAISLVGAFETALVDLMARLLDAPLVELLGGRRPAPVASAGLIDLADGADAALASVRSMAANQHVGLALLPSDDPTADAEAILALRAELGPEAWLSLIGTRRWSLAEALIVGQATEAACLAFIADPVASPESLRRLRRDIRTPLASTWPVADPATMAPLLRNARLDVLLGGCMLQGPFGFTDLAANARAYQRDLAVPALPGCSLAAATDLHLAAAAGQVNHPVVDMTPVLEAGVLDRPLAHAGGSWRLPEGPGIGARPDAAALAAESIETVEVPAP